MSIRQQYLNYANHVIATLDSLEMKNETLEKLKTDLQQVELLIPVIGAFSAGKSTLINSFLGNNLLPTAITPETALATELRYSSEDYIEAISLKDEVTRYELADLTTLKDNAKNYKYLRIYLNNDNLKAIQPLILVDMPGFDAPIEAHNQAILNYLAKGIHFVFLTSVTDGNITSSMKRELNNLQLFNKTFSFGISKTNLKPAEDVEQVKQVITEQLADYHYAEEVILFNQNGGDNLKALLKSIDPEQLLESLFADLLKQNYLEIIENINLNISTLKTDKDEAQKAIKLLKDSILKLQQEKNNAIEELGFTYSQNRIPRIAKEVSNELFLRKDSLINLAIHNPEGLSHEINSLTKDKLLSEVQRHFKEMNADIVVNISNKIKTEFAKEDTSTSLLKNIDLQRLQENTSLLLTKAQTGLQNLNNNLQSQKTQKNATNTIRAIATIAAVTTSIVNPALELVIIFLPEIINFFTQQQREEKARQNAEKHIIYKVIPDIERKLKEGLPEAFNDQLQLMVNQINEHIEAQLQQKQEEIEQAEKARSEQGADLDMRIQTLENGKKSITQTATKYLFNA